MAESRVARLRREANELQDAMIRYGFDELVVPNHPDPDMKRPMVKHINGQWTLELMRDYFATCNYGPLGLLLHSMIVLDFDSAEAFDSMAPLFPVLTDPATPYETTKKGRHVFLRRTALTEQLELHDGARKLYENGEEMKIDIKTECSPKLQRTEPTAGYLQIAPSPGKKWVVPLRDFPPPPMPDDMARWIAARIQSKPKKGPKGAAAPRKRKRRVAAAAADGAGAAHAALASSASRGTTSWYAGAAPFEAHAAGGRSTSRATATQ